MRMDDVASNICQALPCSMSFHTSWMRSLGGSPARRARC